MEERGACTSPGQVSVDGGCDVHLTDGRHGSQCLTTQCSGPACIECRIGVEVGVHVMQAISQCMLHRSTCWNGGQGCGRQTLFAPIPLHSVETAALHGCTWWKDRGNRGPSTLFECVMMAGFRHCRVARTPTHPSCCEQCQCGHMNSTRACM